MSLPDKRNGSPLIWSGTIFQAWKRVCEVRLKQLGVLFSGFHLRIDSMSRAPYLPVGQEYHPYAKLNVHEVITYLIWPFIIALWMLSSEGSRWREKMKRVDLGIYCFTVRPLLTLIESLLILEPCLLKNLCSEEKGLCAQFVIANV